MKYHKDNPHFQKICCLNIPSFKHSKSPPPPGGGRCGRPAGPVEAAAGVSSEGSRRVPPPQVAPQVPPAHVSARQGKAPPLPDGEAASPARCPGPGQVSSPLFRSGLGLPRDSRGTPPKRTASLGGGTVADTGGLIG